MIKDELIAKGFSEAQIIEKKDFSANDLKNADGSNLIFITCRFDRANLNNSKFCNSYFIGCTFQRVCWENSDLEKSTFVADAENIEWISYDGEINGISDYENFTKERKIWHDGEELKEDLELIKGALPIVSFRSSNLFGTQFIGSGPGKGQILRVMDSDFSLTDLAKARFIYCDLSYSTFSGAHFHALEEDGTIFGQGTLLEFTDFSNTNLSNIEFIGCISLEAADFEGADLKFAKFIGNVNNEGKQLSLYRTNFDKSRLKKALFDCCDLTLASFRDADLDGVSFSNPKKMYFQEELETTARAAIFDGSSMSGISLNPRAKHKFVAASFSGSFLGSSIEDNFQEDTGYPPADLSGAILDGAIFAQAMLPGVKFDKSSLRGADFRFATFGSPSSTESTFTNEFNKVDFTEANLSNVVLLNTKFNQCKLRNVSFDNSILSDSLFLWDSNATSDEEFSLDYASFSDSEIKNATFEHKCEDRIGMYRCDFSGADLSGTIIKGFRLSYGDFVQSNLKDAQLISCESKYTNFSRARLDNLQVIQAVLDYASFHRCDGRNINITLLTQNGSDGQEGITFEHHSLEGTFVGSFVGTNIYQGSISFSRGSQVEFIRGMKADGARLELSSSSELKINSSILVNSLVKIQERCRFIVNDTTISSSTLEGLSESCELKNPTLDSCYISTGWQYARVKGATINSTKLDLNGSLKNAERASIKKIMESISENHDIPSIAALRANAKSMGDNDLEDLYFSFERRSEGSKRLVSGASFAFYFGFLILPLILSPTLTLQFTLISSILFGFFIYFASKSFGEIMDLISGYGTSIKKIILTSGAIVISYAGSYSLFNLRIYNHSFFEPINLLRSLHISANSFFALGFWGVGSSSNIFQPDEICLRLYINTESGMGVLILALIVATIIRSTMAR